MGGAALGKTPCLVQVEIKEGRGGLGEGKCELEREGHMPLCLAVT